MWPPQAPLLAKEARNRAPYRRGSSSAVVVSSRAFARHGLAPSPHEQTLPTRTKPSRTNSFHTTMLTRLRPGLRGSFSIDLGIAFGWFACLIWRGGRGLGRDREESTLFV